MFIRFVALTLSDKYFIFAGLKAERMEESVICSEAAADMEHFFPGDAPARNTFRGLCFVLSAGGEATVEIDSRPYRFGPGALLTLLPGHLLQTVGRTADFHCRLVAFPFEFMTDFPYMLQSRISEKMGQMPYLLLDPDEQTLLPEHYRAIARHYPRTEHSSYREILRCLLFAFTAEVCAIYSGRPVRVSVTHREELTDRFFSLLHANFHSHRNAAFYAGQLCITPKHLAKVLRQTTGYLPSNWIADFTVRELKSLLCSTSLTVTQLADRLNFPDSSFLARYFRRHTGMSPREYRLRQGK